MIPSKQKRSWFVALQPEDDAGDILSQYARRRKIVTGKWQDRTIKIIATDNGYDIIVNGIKMRQGVPLTLLPDSIRKALRDKIPW